MKEISFTLRNGKVIAFPNHSLQNWLIGRSSWLEIQPASYISVAPSSGKFLRTTSDILQYVCLVHRWLQCFFKLFTTFAKDDFFTNFICWVTRNLCAKNFDIL